PGGLTRLDNGKLEMSKIVMGEEVPSTYYLTTGLLEGHGQIIGNISTDRQAIDKYSRAKGPVIHPGLGDGTDTLTITVNLTLTPEANVRINVHASGNVGHLVAKELIKNDGGQATLFGTLRVERNPKYIPASTDPPRTILEFASRG